MKRVSIVLVSLFALGATTNALRIVIPASLALLTGSFRLNSKIIAKRQHKAVRSRSVGNDSSHTSDSGVMPRTECMHCHRSFSSRNKLFEHLHRYPSHKQASTSSPQTASDSHAKASTGSPQTATDFSMSGEDFKASDTFKGTYPGYVFKLGDKGQGYYKDVPAVSSQVSDSHVQEASISREKERPVPVRVQSAQSIVSNASEEVPVRAQSAQSIVSNASEDYDDSCDNPRRKKKCTSDEWCIENFGTPSPTQKRHCCQNVMAYVYCRRTNWNRFTGRCPGSCITCPGGLMLRGCCEPVQVAKCDPSTCVDDLVTCPRCLSEVPRETMCQSPEGS